MLHHTAPDEVAEVIEEVARDALRSGIRGHSTAPPRTTATVPQDQQPARAVE
jgi:hypothetical protein